MFNIGIFAAPSAIEFGFSG